MATSRSPPQYERSKARIAWSASLSSYPPRSAFISFTDGIELVRNPRWNARVGELVTPVNAPFGCGGGGESQCPPFPFPCTPRKTERVSGSGGGRAPGIVFRLPSKIGAEGAVEAPTRLRENCAPMRKVFLGPTVVVHPLSSKVASLILVAVQNRYPERGV